MKKFDGHIVLEPKDLNYIILAIERQIVELQKEIDSKSEYDRVDLEEDLSFLSSLVGELEKSAEVWSHYLKEEIAKYMKER